MEVNEKGTVHDQNNLKPKGFYDMEKIRNFCPEEDFFIISSDNLDQTESRLYGFIVMDDMITNDISYLNSFPPSPNGTYVLVKRDGDSIAVYQDFSGSYGIYLYEKDGYFALSNSFAALTDYLKSRKPISFNKPYADYFLTSGLCASVFSETMIREIRLVDRSAVIEIDIPEKKLSERYIDYKENSVMLGSAEGIAVLDKWFMRWANIFRGLQKDNRNMTFNLSGGFDTRVTLALAVRSGIDINKTHLYSASDGLHTHSEDYEIAKQIADYYGFELNDRSKLSGGKANYSLSDIIEISYYIKECFHNQKYHQYSYHDEPVFVIGGEGGENIRNFINDSEENLTLQYLKRGDKITLNSYEVNKSIRKIFKTTFDEIRRKMERNGRQIIDSSIGMELYRETRNRNHFGKIKVEHYYGNRIEMAPIMDAELNKLEVITDGKHNGDVIYAVIIDRYCPELLNFKIEGGRSFSEEALQLAKQINAEFPFDSGTVSNADFSVRMTSKKMKDTEKVSPDRLNKLYIDAFGSKDIHNTFVLLYGERAYEYILNDYKGRKFCPLQLVYPALGICKIYNDVKANQALMSTPCSYFQAVGGTPACLTLMSSPVAENYVAARFDINNEGSKNNSVEICEISDKNVQVNAPKWFANNGHGKVIISKLGNISIRIRCVGNGTFKLYLRSRFLTDDKGKRYPFYIDYSYLAVNDKVLISDATPIMHDRPYRFEMSVSDGEIVTVSAKWSPHDPRISIN